MPEASAEPGHAEPPAGGHAPAGYSGTPLARKLGIKRGHAVTLLQAPPGFAGTLGELPDGVMVSDRLPAGTPADVILFFVTWRAELAADIGALRHQLPAAGSLWVAWPKKTARLPTDMTEHAVRELALPLGLVDNKVCAIDQTWTALRLVIRRELR